MSQAQSLAAHVEDPAARLAWAAVERALADLRDRRLHDDAARYLREMLPMLAATIDAGDIEQAIRTWTTARYDRGDNARFFERDGNGAKPARLHWQSRHA